MIDLIVKSSRVLAVVVTAVLLVGLAAYMGARYGIAAQKPTVFKSAGPTIKQLEGMGHLAATRVHVTDVLTGEGEGYRGSWLIKGDAILTCDLSRATITFTDENLQRATIRLPGIAVTSPRVDHEKTKTWNVETATWLPWKWGDEDRFRDSAMYHSQRLIEDAAGSEENIRHAKTHAELALRKAYELVEWHVSVEWVE